MQLFLQSVKTSRVGVHQGPVRRTDTFCRIEYFRHSQSRRRGGLSDGYYGGRHGVFSREKMGRGKEEKVREVNWRRHISTLESVGNVGRFSLGAFSIAEKEIGI